MARPPRLLVPTSPGSTSCQFLIHLLPPSLPDSCSVSPHLSLDALTAISVPEPMDLFTISSPKQAAGAHTTAHSASSIPWILQIPLPCGFLSSLPLGPLSPSLFSYCSPTIHANLRIGFDGILQSTYLFPPLAGSLRADAFLSPSACPQWEAQC